MFYGELWNLLEFLCPAALPHGSTLPSSQRADTLAQLRWTRGCGFCLYALSTRCETFEVDALAFGVLAFQPGILWRTTKMDLRMQELNGLPPGGTFELCTKPLRVVAQQIHCWTEGGRVITYIEDAANANSLKNAKGYGFTLISRRVTAWFPGSAMCQVKPFRLPWHCTAGCAALLAYASRGILQRLPL